MGLVSTMAFGASAVTGLLTADGVTGRNATPSGWSEEKAYIGQLDVGEGAAGGTWWDPPGWYRIPQVTPPTWFPGGTYALFTLRFNGVPAFSYDMTLELPGGAEIVENTRLNTPAHYSVMYNVSYTEWSPAPWLWGTDFYQTFVATGPHITRVGTKLAGKGGDHQELTLNFGVYQTNDGLPSTWQRISPMRSLWISGNTDPIIHVFWEPFRSNEMELTPGQTYAVRFWRDPSSPSPDFAIVARPDFGDGYEGGQLYSGNTSHEIKDAYGYVSGGEAGTIINHAPVNDIQVGPMATWTTSFGQTFQASGTSVAAAEIMYADGEPSPLTLRIDFQVYDGVGGAPIGPRKSCWGNPGHYEGRAAAIWREGEVPTIPGQMYYIEWTTPPSGCNTWFMRDNPPGEAYVNRQSRPSNDLLMCIAEYLAPGPMISLSTSEMSLNVEEGDNLPADTFTVRNTGGETLNYTITDDVSWLDVSPTSGSSNGEPDTITITYNTASLSIDMYTGTITVADPGALNLQQTIAVTLDVVQPVIPGDFNFDGDVDQTDFGHLQSCFSGAGVEQNDFRCLDALLDEDEDVDVDDFGIFQACMSGADVPADPDCRN